MEVAIKILQFIAAFSLLIIVHELGHFLFARLFGIRVEKFYLFFDPWFSLVKFKYKGTEYGIGWVPFGGYVKIAGMIDESMDTESMKKPPEKDEFRAKPAWQRLFVMLGGVMMNILLAVAIYVGIMWHWGDTYIAPQDIKYGYVFNDLGHEIGFRDGDVILSSGGKSYADVDELITAIMLDKPGWVSVLRGGDTVNVEIAEHYIAAMLKSEDLLTIRIPFVIRNVSPGLAAADAGVEPGDRLVKVDTLDAGFREEAFAALEAFKGTTALLTFERDSAGVTVQRELPVEISAAGKIGVELAPPTDLFAIHDRHYNFLQAIPAGVKLTGTKISDYWKQIKMIADPKTEAYKSLSGPLGIGNMFPTFWSWYIFWNFTALISIVLAVMNILPVPALDGGHVLFTLYEMITGRKPNDRFIEFAQVLGMAIILLVILYATGNDIYRIFIK